MYETDNDIGADGAKAIAEALKENTTLKRLDLLRKYRTHSPSFSHDSRFDLSPCVRTTTKRTKKKNVRHMSFRSYSIEKLFFFNFDFLSTR